MFKFGVRNLRRLKNVPAIPIAPITLLVGRNSSGKSSFLRALPLLRQSVQTRTSAPILWFGDLVDFGSYLGSVSDNDIRQHISFQFELDRVSVDLRPRFYPPFRSGYYRREREYTNVGLTVSIAARDDDVWLKTAILTWDQNTFQLELTGSGDVEALLLNDQPIRDYFSNVKMGVPRGSIFPELLTAAVDPKADGHDLYYPPEFYSLARSLANFLEPHLTKRLSKSTSLLELCGEFLELPSLEKGVVSDYLQSVSSRSWKNFVSRLIESDPDNLMPVVRMIHRSAMFVPLVRGAAQSLQRTMSEVLYIGPARARSERYYRYQELAVSEIDPDGKNFAMFLNSLRADQFGNLSDWIQSLFGYSLSLTRTQGHISINLLENRATTNVVDTGYGVSQILPVLGQMWWASNRDLGSRPRAPTSQVSLLAIEQPELHLHPAHQALLADALAQAPRGPSRPINYLIETHSEALVNRLGVLVSEGRLRAADVQVILFEPDTDDPRRTNAKVAAFGDAGELIDWPYGFFQPE